MSENFEVRILSLSAQNSGEGRWQAVVRQDGATRRISGKFEKTNSQRLAVQAVTEVLRTIPEKASVAVKISSDYLVNVANGQWKRKKNVDVWDDLEEEMSRHVVTVSKLDSNSDPGEEPSIDEASGVRDHKHGVARFKLNMDEHRASAHQTLSEHGEFEENDSEYISWRLRAIEKKEKLIATLYQSGVLLIQGSQTEFFDRVCSEIEAVIDLEVGEVASRFITRDPAQAEKFVNLFSEQLVENATTRAKKELGDAFVFLQDHDQRYAVSSFALLDSGIPLPEFSPIVMPIGKAFEGFLRLLFFQIGVITKEESDDRGFQIGRVFDLRSHNRSKDFVGHDPILKGLFKSLDGALNESRHLMMHSHGEAGLELNNVGDAETLVSKTAQMMRRSHETLT